MSLLGIGFVGVRQDALLDLLRKIGHTLCCLLLLEIGLHDGAHLHVGVSFYLLDRQLMFQCLVLADKS